MEKIYNKNIKKQKKEYVYILDTFNEKVIKIDENAPLKNYVLIDPQYICHTNRIGLRILLPDDYFENYSLYQNMPLKSFSQEMMVNINWRWRPRKKFKGMQFDEVHRQLLKEGYTNKSRCTYLK